MFLKKTCKFVNCPRLQHWHSTYHNWPQPSTLTWKKRSIKIRENLHTTNLLSFWNLHKRDDGPETLTWGRVRFDLMGRDWTIFGGGLLDKAIWQRFVALEKNTVFSYIFLNIVPMIFYFYILRIYHDFINHLLTC